VLNSLPLGVSCLRAIEVSLRAERYGKFPQIIKYQVNFSQSKLPMNLLNLPVFILLLAIAYLTIVYGLLKIVETQKGNTTVVNDRSTVDSNQPMNAP